MANLKTDGARFNGSSFFDNSESFMDELSDDELALVNGGFASVNAKLYAHTTTANSWYTDVDNLRIKDRFHSILG